MGGTATSTVGIFGFLESPVGIAALVAGAISTLVAFANRWTLISSNNSKLRADREALRSRIIADVVLAVERASAERDGALSDKGWSEYLSRRELYVELAARLDFLFSGTGSHEERLELHRTARKVRLVGSDEVVLALNAMTASIKEGQPTQERDQRYRALFLAMRHDMRQDQTAPPRSTVLDKTAFPIEF